MDQTHLTVNDAYQTFFTKLRVENDVTPITAQHNSCSGKQSATEYAKPGARTKTTQSRSQPVGFNNHGN
jgi:hypothetical protein